MSINKEGRKFDIDDYLKIDSDLCLIKFDSISVTGTVGNFLIKGFTDTNYYPYSLKANIIRFITHIRLYFHFLYRYKSRQNYKCDLNRPYWFILNSTDKRFLDLIYPIIEVLGRENCVIFSSVKNYKTEINDLFYSYPVLDKKDFCDWKKKFNAEKEMISSALKKIKVTYDLSSHAYKLLESSIIYQSQLIFKFSQLIKKHQPRAVITDADRHKESSALLTTGNHFKINTFGLIHGSVFPPDSYIPFISQKILCWGESSFHHLKKFESIQGQLTITGNPKISSLYFNIDNVKIETELGVNKNRIVLISNNIDITERLKLTDDYCRATQRLTSVNSYIRLHPAEHISEYDSILRKYNHVKILDNNTLTLDETIYAAKIIVINNSTVGIEALVKNKNVIVLDTIDYDIGLGNELCERAYCLRAKSSEELQNHINNLISSDDLYQKQLLLSKEFIHDYCAYFGEESAKLISNLIIHSDDH